MEGRCTDAALSRRQRVFVCLEDSPGMLTFPKQRDAIRPAGDATMNQVPAYTDSSEKFDTLDLLDQFPNSLPPGDWLIPQYVRLDGYGGRPQGLDLFEALMGKHGAEFSAELAGDASESATGIKLASISGDVPPVGVIQVEDEIIRYGRYNRVTSELLDCIRGYDNTTPADHAEGEALTSLADLYLLDACSPTLSIWIETDHLLQFMSGCLVEEVTVPVQNQDGFKLTFKGRGMAMGWAGVSPLKEDAASGDAEIVVDEPKRFCVGARLYNKTRNEFGTDGYEIMDVNLVSGLVTLKTPLVDDWSAGDLVTGYLPPADIGGDAILSRDTAISLNGVRGKVTSTNLVIGTPKEFLEEVGTKYPEEYVGVARKITMNVDSILRRADVDKFYEGYNGKELEAIITVGDAPGKKITFFMPRLKTTSPTVNFSGQAVTLQIQGTALGKVDGSQIGENSICIVFE